ncbi:MAG: non-canonical purine NTP diphosphatase [Flavobacteriales bacterium]|nr:non-canonical purine NTP diphosphatase [Flavobacteriales bacterium]MCB9173014.1 non-canonical purine NTP diphosphatase [Flavobacteriales bacterium]
MLKLVFATNNKNKIKEIKHLIGNSIELLSLEDIGCVEDIPETSDTIQGNAIQKAKYVYDNYGYNCFADDTGLEIDELNGEPGIYSARYAGEQRNSEDNMNKVLEKLNDATNRNAQFKTVIALIINGEISCFEGIVKGEMTRVRSGEEGFGYDPIFKPKGYDITYSEMNLELKNKISHRALATHQLIEHLQKMSSF